jgi:hypothetical protein
MAGSDAGVLDVLSCYSCGERHEGVTLHAFNKPIEPWTHWYTCPDSGDPVTLSVDGKHAAPVERVRRVVTDIERAAQVGRWLACIFFVEEGPRRGELITTLLWNQEDFPHAVYENCQDLLAKECAKHGGLPAPVAPLPRANGPLSKLFRPIAEPMPPLNGDQAEPGNG